MGCDVEPRSLVQGKPYTVATASFEATLLHRDSDGMTLRLSSDGEQPRDLAVPLWFTEQYCTFGHSGTEISEAEEDERPHRGESRATAHVEAGVLEDELSEVDDAKECEELEAVSAVAGATAPTSTDTADVRGPPAENLLLVVSPEVAQGRHLEERPSEVGSGETEQDAVEVLIESEQQHTSSLAAGTHPSTDNYSHPEAEELTRGDIAVCGENTIPTTSAVGAMLETWRSYPAAVAEVSDETLEWIHREGTLSDRGDAVIFLADRWADETHDGSLWRWTVSFQRVLAFIDGLCARLQQLGSVDRASERSELLVWSLIEMYGRCLPWESSLDPGYFRDRVLLPLAHVGYSERHGTQLLDLLQRYLHCKTTQVEQKRALCSRSLVHDFFFRVVEWGPRVCWSVLTLFSSLFNTGPRTAAAKKDLLWRSGIKEFLTALCRAAPPDTAKKDLCGTVCFAIVAVSNETGVVPPRFPNGFCPLLDDAEFFKTAVFPLFRHPLGRALQLLPAVIQSLRSEYFASPEFRDCVLLPNVSKSLSAGGTIIEVLDAVLQCNADQAQLRDVFASTKCLARCFSVILKRARDIVAAIRRKRQRSKEALKRIDEDEDEHDTAKMLRVSSVAAATFSMLHRLLGLPLVGDGPDRACATGEGSHGWRGADTPAWGSPVLFNDVIVPFLALAPLTKHAELFDVVRAFWARRPTFLTAEQLRDTVIIPLVRTDVDVDPLLFQLLARADDATAEGAAFKDAFAAPAAFMMFDKQGPAHRDPALVARCLLLTVRDGAVLNGRRADALSAVCRRLLRVNHNDIGWNKYCPIAMLLVAMTGRAPGEAENATIARHAALCDRLVLPKFLDLIVQDRARESEQFLFRGLRLAMRNSDEEARHKILSHTVLPFGHGALMATIKRIASAADAEHCLDVLAAGGRDLRESHVDEYLFGARPHVHHRGGGRGHGPLCRQFGCGETEVAWAAGCAWLAPGVSVRRSTIASATKTDPTHDQRQERIRV